MDQYEKPTLIEAGIWDRDQQIEIFRSWLEDALPSDKYHDLTFLRDEGTRVIFNVLWGAGNEPRLVKVDKRPNTLDSARSARHVARGYDTSNDIKALSSLRNPEEHYLTRLCDFEHIEMGSLSVDISIEQYYENCLTLEDAVWHREGKGNLSVHPLDIAAFERFADQSLIGLKYLIEEAHMFHRDVKPANILLAKTRTGRDVRYTDFANACSVDDVVAQAFPTTGGHMVLDPLICEAFTGMESSYTEQAELYAWGVNAFFALTGTYAVECDQDEHTAHMWTPEGHPLGISLMKDDGLLNLDEYERVLELALKRIPKESRKYSELIRNCLTIQTDNRHSNIGELYDEFKEVKSFDPKKVTRRVALGTGAVAATAVVGAGLWRFGDLAERLADAVDDQTYKIEGSWDLRKQMQIKNNGFEFGIAIDPGNAVMFPTEKFVRTNPGEEMWVYLKARYASIPDGIIHPDWVGISQAYPGQAYFEGFSPQEFTLIPDINDEGTPEMHDNIVIKERSKHDVGSVEFKMKVPTEVTPGTYLLVTELYAPGGVRSQDKLEFPNPGKALIRQRVPVVIGKPVIPEIIDATTLWMGSTPYASFQDILDLNRDLRHNLSYQINIPEEDIGETFSDPDRGYSMNSFGNWLPMPDGTTLNEQTLWTTVRSGGQIVSRTSFPIRRQKDCPSNWELYLPDKNYAHRLIENMPR